MKKPLLTSAQAPIVLLRRISDEIAPNAAPDNPYLGVMLPYTPLHHLLMAELGFAVIATSGNRSGEPICIDEHEALERLDGIADLFLVHDRPIARHVDDSVMRVAAGRDLMLRRARGYAPLPLDLPENTPARIAVGAHQKNTIAVSVGDQAFVSQHIGDLDSAQAADAFAQAIHDLSGVYDIHADEIVCDLHPDYRSTQYAEASGLPVTHVQHHYAHILACMAESHLTPPLLGIAWDGTGLGTDGTIWGGEFLHISEHGFERAAHLRTFPLPGGDAAAREPRRSALGVLYELYGDNLPPVPGFAPAEQRLLVQALESGVNAPLTSSMGRLFDAVAALIGLPNIVTFEGQAAMQLEFAAEAATTDAAYPFILRDGVIDWQPLIEVLLADRQHGVAVSEIAAKFHKTLAAVAESVAKKVGEERVALSGGCFQNRVLLEKTVARLQRAGFRPYWHRLIPPNDGGIAYGQLAFQQGGRTPCAPTDSGQTHGSAPTKTSRETSVALEGTQDEF